MKKIKINQVKAQKILNSAGVFSIEVTVTTPKGSFSASIPKGTSEGKHEAKEFAKGIDNAIKATNTIIAKNLKKAKISSLKDILAFEQYTQKFGGNVVLAVSFSLLKALAAEKKVPVWKIFKPKKKKIPQLLNKMLGGGLHAGGDTPDFQEFLILSNMNHNLKVHKAIKKRYNPPGKDLEGGWALDISDEMAFAILKKFNKKGRLGADFAASDIYNSKSRFYEYKNSEHLSKKAQINYILKLQKKFSLYYLEDPLQEDDFEGFAELTKELGRKALIVGDDLLTTNPERLKKAISLGACNSCIVKPDQVGSLAKTIEFVKMAKKNKYIPVISHRSGETNDNIIADLAVGLEIPIIKIGIVGGERVSKINRLIKIDGE